MRNFINCVRITKYYYSDQIREDEMGGSCNTYGVKTTRNYWQDINMDGKMILKQILKETGCGMDSFGSG